MGLLEILILAVVQGLTEFLPVSSSGHLVVGGALLRDLGARVPERLLEVNIVLHFGTLLAVLVYYRRRVLRLVREDRRVVLLLVAGTLPAVVVALLLKQFDLAVPESPLLAGIMFPVTAGLLLWTRQAPPGDKEYVRLGFAACVLIGLLQAFAILPGVSRSGATIAGGLLLGMRRESATTFAFLLAIPAIAGAGVLEAYDLWLDYQSTQQLGVTTSAGILLAGLLTSFAVGLAALAILIRIIERGRISWFAFYVLPLGAVVVLWQAAPLVLAGFSAEFP